MEDPLPAGFFIKSIDAGAADISLIFAVVPLSLARVGDVPICKISSAREVTVSARKMSMARKHPVLAR